VNPQPLIAVHDVEVSSQWYQTVFDCQSNHGGLEYEQLVSDGRLIMQLHHWNAPDHPYLGSPESQPYGNGVLLWFQTDRFDETLLRIQSCGAQVLEGPQVNPNANHREIWLRDPDGYIVVVASAYGDLG
jgi:predicted enzyme related to lactoylglutathione lyase